MFMIGAMMLSLHAAVAEMPPAPRAREGVTLYVSKIGDNSDGTSWAKAFHSVQAALQALPDADGGHRVIVRPDTYMEANLWPNQKGAADAYNELIGDFDGRWGSGASGWAVIDSSDPGKGFKSYDWYGPIRATQKGWSPEHKDETFSAIGWDRWVVRHLYVTGGDAGLFWDCTDHIEPFTVVVEDCVSIGRAFGGGVASCLSRTEEPIVFRRCKLWALDWWGDTAGGYVRIENTAMPDRPDVFFEECTLVSPQCALKVGNFGFKTFTRVKVNQCRLIALNFSQPAGTPIDGAVQSVEDGKFLHLDAEDTTIMGYKVFGVRVNKDTEKAIQYTTKGSCLAYVQYQQKAPEGFLQLGGWPVDVFDTLLTPPPLKRRPATSKEGPILRDMCEVAPIVWQGRLCLMACVRPASGGTKADYYLRLNDAETGEELTRFAEGYSLAAAHVEEGVFYAYASRFEKENWNDVTVFKSRNLKDWEQNIAIAQNDNEHLFNSSVCAGREGYIMAYESNDPAYPAFTIKFAHSNDLLQWQKIPDAVFGIDRYTACPCIRYVNGYYYLLYLEHRTPRWYFQTYIARSKDLRTWELSGANPVLTPDGIDEGINASDPDVLEFGGKTYLYYAVGDQLTWMNIKRQAYAGSMAAFLEAWFPAR